MPHFPAAGSTNLNVLTRSLLRSKTSSTSTTTASNCFSSSKVSNQSSHCNGCPNMTTTRMSRHGHDLIQNHNQAIQRFFTTSIKKDKYGRFVKRRMVVIKNKSSKLDKKAKKPKSNWPKIHKIITPTNVLPQPIQPPPTLKNINSRINELNLNLNPLLASQPAKSSNVASNILSSTMTTTNNNSAVIATIASNGGKKSHNKFREWLKENIGVIILNIGSFATLTAFTRTDMLELRLLSMAGSSSTVYYFATRKPPLVYGPIVWASIFLFTNTLMAYYILEEREGKTRQFTSEEEDVYEEHFLPYGVTPRQYEKLLNVAQTIKLKRGEVLMKQDSKFDAVYLVTNGSTEAMTGMNRKVTAASSVKGNKDKLNGGDAGAWIGELSFLEILGEKQHKGPKVISNKSSPSTIVNISFLQDQGDDGKESVVRTLATAAVNALERTNSRHRILQSNDSNTNSTTNNNVEQQQPQSPANNRRTNKALLTYIANQDSTLYKWDFDELAALLATSAELRLAVTRAMTAAVLNKVVNLYVSKQDADTDTSLWKRWIEGMNKTTDTIVNEEEDDLRRAHRDTVRLNVAR